MQSLLNSYGLNMFRICWEDTTCSKNSYWCPNIFDMTLMSHGKDCQVIRRSNFADVTVEHPLDNFNVTIGNEKSKGTQHERISLKEYLETLDININSEEQVLCSNMYSREFYWRYPI